jgi:hypothetical protein
MEKKRALAVDALQPTVSLPVPHLVPVQLVIRSAFCRLVSVLPPLLPLLPPMVEVSRSCLKLRLKCYPSQAISILRTARV